MSQTSHGGLSPALIESVAGLSAGAVATLIVHPLDIVKTRMQIHRSSAPGPPIPPTTVAVIRSLTQNPKPLASLYRGLGPNLLGNATSWASFFFFKSRVERAVAIWKTKASFSGTGSRVATKEALATYDFFLSSAVAGALTQVLTNPIWVLKTRMLSSDRSAEGAYPSMIAGARQIYATEGFRGFYRGLAVGLVGVSHGAVQFAVYEPLKRIYIRGKGLPERLDQSRGDGATARLANEATVAISTVSKLTAGAVTYPYQVLRSRLQNYNADERFGRGIRGVASILWREEGIRGFYRGLIPGVVRVMPATWVTFLVYENMKYYLPHLLGE